jgi:hypothetical protein
MIMMVMVMMMVVVTMMIMMDHDHDDNDDDDDLTSSSDPCSSSWPLGGCEVTLTHLRGVTSRLAPPSIPAPRGGYKHENGRNLRKNRSE